MTGAQPYQECGDRRTGGRFLCLLLLAAMACLLLTFFWPAGEVRAYTVKKSPQDAVTDLLTISPTSFEFDALPGQVIDREVTITNRTGHTVELYFSSEDFTGSQNPDVATVILGDQASEHGARDWLEPEITQITSEHGDNLTMRVRTIVPKDAAPGGYYAVFLAGFGTQVGGVNMVSRVGCFFLITVPGPVTEAGTVDPPQAPSISWTGPVDIGVVFNNQGNVHLHPSGVMRIRNMFGMTVSEMPINEWIVMPESSRRNMVSWERWLMFGRYSAEAEVTYGSDTRTLTATGSYWAFSWQLLVGLGVLIAAVVGFFWYRHRKKKRLALEAAAAAAAAEGAEAGAGDAGGAEGATPPGGAPGLAPELVALGEIMPSLGDGRVIDINDEETRTLLRQLVAEELELARALIAAGSVDEATVNLRALRRAAMRLRFLDETVMIDDLLLSL